VVLCSLGNEATVEAPNAVRMLISKLGRNKGRRVQRRGSSVTVIKHKKFCLCNPMR